MAIEIIPTKHQKVLMENSIAIIHLLELAKNLTGIKRDFVEALQNLQSIVREKLLTTPVELEERKYYIGKVVQRENKILKVKEKLQMDYDQQIILKKEEVFVKLQNKLYCVRKK